MTELSTVAPDGSATLITWGELIGTQRAIDTRRNWYDTQGRLIVPYHPFNLDSERLVPPGKIERYDLELRPRLISIAPGDRLTLKITSRGNFDKLKPSPTPLQLSRLTEGKYEIQRSCQSASCMNLPLLPYMHFSSVTNEVWPFNFIAINYDQPGSDGKPQYDRGG
jgi:hypothetical protein